MKHATRPCDNSAESSRPKKSRASSEYGPGRMNPFGGIEQTKEIAREQRVWRWADEFLQDIRFGARMLRRSPGFSILAILCLTLGIGTNAAVLSWIEGILIRPYPLVAHQDRMFALFWHQTRGTTGLAPDFLIPTFSISKKTRRFSNHSLSIKSLAQR